MLQRRQTLYLLTIVILGVVLYFCSVLQLTTTATESLQRMFYIAATGIEEVTPEMEFMTLDPIVVKGMWGLQVATILIPLLALIDIFLYKKRLLQARLNIFLAAICLGYYAILAAEVWFIRQNLHAIHCINTEWDICFGLCIPLVCLILTFGATRLILKDEALVRSADRIR